MPLENFTPTIHLFNQQKCVRLAIASADEGKISNGELARVDVELQRFNQHLC